MFSVSPTSSSILFKLLCDLPNVLCPEFCENAPHKKQMMSTKQGKSECANVNNKSNILGLLKGSRSSAEVGWLMGKMSQA
jgi:hypothetical protein